MKKFVIEHVTAENIKDNNILIDHKSRYHRSPNNMNLYFDTEEEANNVLNKLYAPELKMVKEINLDMYDVRFSDNKMSGQEGLTVAMETGAFNKIGSASIVNYIMVNVIKYISDTFNKLDLFEITKTDMKCASESRMYYLDTTRKSVKFYRDISAYDMDYDRLSDVNALIDSTKLLNDSIIEEHGELLGLYNTEGIDRAINLIKFPYDDRAFLTHMAGFSILPFTIEREENVILLVSPNTPVENVNRFIDISEKYNKTNILHTEIINDDTFERLMTKLSMYTEYGIAPKKPKVVYLVNDSDIFNAPTSLVDEFRYVTPNGNVADLFYHMALEPDFSITKLIETCMPTIKNSKTIDIDDKLKTLIRDKMTILSRSKRRNCNIQLEGFINSLSL